MDDEKIVCVSVQALTKIDEYALEEVALVHRREYNRGRKSLSVYDNRRIVVVLLDSETHSFRQALGLAILVNLNETWQEIKSKRRKKKIEKPKKKKEGGRVHWQIGMVSSLW
jgi:hypothetical protein